MAIRVSNRNIDQVNPASIQQLPHVTIEEYYLSYIFSLINTIRMTSEVFNSELHKQVNTNKFNKTTVVTSFSDGDECPLYLSRLKSNYKSSLGNENMSGELFDITLENIRSANL